MSHDKHIGPFEDFRGEKPIYNPKCPHCNPKAGTATKKRK